MYFLCKYSIIFVLEKKCSRAEVPFETGSPLIFTLCGSKIYILLLDKHNNEADEPWWSPIHNTP